MNPDEIASLVTKKLKIRTSIIGTGNEQFMLIEGDRSSLNFLADLIKSVAHSELGSYSLGPNGQGNVHFAAEAAYGIYINHSDT